MRLLTKSQSKNLDKTSVNKYKIPESKLMHSAAKCIFDYIESHNNTLKKKLRILILCGKGNNGGDSICLANMLKEKGYDVHVHFLLEKNQISNLLLKHHDKYIELSGSISYGIEIKKYDDFDFLVDGIIGIGFREILSQDLIDWVNWINHSDLFVLSVDIPSGLNADNGLASPIAVKANVTITFGYGKIGLYLADGRDHVGEIIIEDIGFPKKALDIKDNIDLKLFTAEEAKEVITKVPSNTYKQDRGKLLIIAGCSGMTGAAILSTYGALRAGAGVTITVCPSSLSNVYEKYILEGMTLSCNDNGKGYLSIDNYDEIMEKIEWADSLVIGPGLGLQKDTIRLVSKLVNTIDKPIVLDADGLASFPFLKSNLDNLVITPHLGEFSKILNIEKKILLNDFIQIVKRFMTEFAGVAIIKHVPVCVINGQKMSLNSTGNPGLATAGSGDVLSGVVASFISQNMNGYDACRLSSYFHGLAADNQIKHKGVRGLIASDLPLEIAKVINEYENL